MQKQEGAEMQNYPPQQTPAGYQQPAAGYQQPPAGYQQPTAGYQQPPAGSYVVQVQPSATPVTHDYTIPSAKAPGILMVMASFFMAFGVTRMNYFAFVVPAAVYGTVGALCLLVHHDNPKGRGLVTWLLALSCMSILLAVDIDGSLIRAIIAGSNLRYGNPGVIIGYGIFLLLVNLITLILSIVLVVFTSKKLCHCCGAP